jgi:hypothetical protein
VEGFGDEAVSRAAASNDSSWRVLPKFDFLACRVARRLAPCVAVAGEQAEVRDDERNHEVECDLDRRRERSLTGEQEVALVDCGQNDPDDGCDLTVRRRFARLQQTAIAAFIGRRRVALRRVAGERT